MTTDQLRLWHNWCHGWGQQLLHSKDSTTACVENQC